MSANPESSTVTDERMPNFFVEEDPFISDECKAIFTAYSGIPETELVPHIRQLRDRAWKTFNYPCIGRYSFLEFSIGDHEIYPKVLENLKHGATLLDLACCFGQDLRKLVHDGVPAMNLTGSELDADFIALGYDLFRDKEKLKATFKTGDFFAPETAGLEYGAYDYIHAASFFHLFPREKQIEAISKCIAMLKQKPGSSIFGRQTGTKTPEELDGTSNGGAYRHSEASFVRLVKEVATKLGVDVDVQCGVADEPWPVSNATEREQGHSTWTRLKYIIAIRSVGA